MRNEKKRLLLDTNVWVAYYLGTPKLGAEVTGLIGACIRCDVELFFAPTTLKDVFYIIPRELKRAEQPGDPATGPESRRAAAWACVRHMDEIAAPAPFTGVECDLAQMLRSMNADLEDNIVMACAETCHADYVVTYDGQLIEAFSPSCITPKQALSAVALWRAGR